MEPESFSASAAAVFETCEARYKAESYEKTPDLQGEHSGLGTACHGALQRWVELGWYLDPTKTIANLEVLFADEYYKIFSEPDKYEEGMKMMKKWLDENNDWNGRRIISTELKEHFLLPFTKPDGSTGTIRFTYIWDRCDEVVVDRDPVVLDLEVIDYKSFSRPLSKDDMRKKIQTRAYGLAAAIKFKGTPYRRIWVIFDLLRYGKVEVCYTREELEATYRYLQALATRIYESDGTKETLNPECKWCVRKNVCGTFQKHLKGGGKLGAIDNKPLDQLIDERADMDALMGGIKDMLTLYDDAIMEELERLNVTDMRTSVTQVEIGSSNRREVESWMVRKIIGDERYAEMGSITVGAVDKLLKDPSISLAQKDQLRSAISKKRGRPFLKTKPIHPLDEED